MKAYHNDPAIKAKYLARVRDHREADQLIKGTYWDNGKGCAVGCTIHGADHSRYETELGIPRVLAKLEDGIFEGLTNGAAQKWPEQFLSAIPVGADLSNVWPQFVIWMLIDERWGVLQFAKKDEAHKAITAVAEAYQLKLSDPKAKINWVKLRRAAYAAYAYAAADAAYAAAYAAAAADYAAYAADAAAYAAADDYAYAAAAAAADAAADDYARHKFRAAQANKLIKLMVNTPVPEPTCPLPPL